MKKFLLLLLTSTILMAGGVSAAPLDDYSTSGNASISFYAMRPDMKGERENPDPYGNFIYDYGNKWSWGGEATIAIAPKWALSTDYAHYKNKKESIFVNTTTTNYMSSNLKSTGIKLKYQAHKDKRLFVAPYLGVSINKLQRRFKADMSQSGYGVFRFAYETQHKIAPVAGVTVVYALDKDSNFKTYFDVAAGKKVYSLNIGLSCKLVKNFDLDFGYKYHKAKGLSYSHPTTYVTGSAGLAVPIPAEHDSITSTSKGIYIGLSYKFK